jgi:S-adenosylmethionine uptake transporter
MPPARNNSNRPVTGILAIVSGLFLFSLQDLAIKHFSGDYSVLQIVVVRGVVATLLVAVVVGLLLGRKGFTVRNPGLILGKGLLAFCSYLAYYLAVASMPLADVVAITFSAPIFVTVMSALMLREAVGMRRWLAVIVGFAGALLVVAPGGKVVDIAVAFAGLAALSYALNSVMARYIGPEDKPWTVTFYFTVAHLLGGIVVSLAVFAFGSGIEADHPSVAFLLRSWSTGNELDLLLMGALGINAALGAYFLNKAYLSAPASTVAPFEYTYLIWAVLFGYIFWSEVPSPSTVAGITLLVSGNLYILHCQLRYSRREKQLEMVKEPYPERELTSTQPAWSTS